MVKTLSYKKAVPAKTKVLSYKQYREKMEAKAYLDSIMGPLKKKVGLQAWKAQARALPKETRQAILDSMHAGLTFGKIQELHKIEQNVALGIYMINSEKHTFTILRKITK